jgi:hypothetical protein
MNMNKFQKRIKKLSKNCQTAIVVGSAFGHLEELLEIFNTVFVIATSTPSVKAKNLVYRESFDNFEQLSDINFVFYDLSEVSMLNRSSSVWHRSHPLVIIEGKEVIGRDLSGPLYSSGYNAIYQDKEYHVWRLKQ